MNICIIAPRYPYKDNMEFVFVKKLVDEWAKMGHKCTVVTFFSLNTYLRNRIVYKPTHYRDEIEKGIFVDVYNPRVISLGHVKYRGTSVNEWICSKEFSNFLKKSKVKFDLIYCHFFNSALIAFNAAMKHEIPLFVATGESNLKDLGAFRKPFPSFRLRDFRSYVKGIIAVSNKNKEEATEGGLIEPARCKVFPNGTDLSIFHPMDRKDCREKLNLPQDAFIISCVGFFCERKGQNRLLEAVRKLGIKDIKLLFIGKAAKIETFALEGDEILFKGSVENKDLPNYLCASDVFCLPTRAEGCCNAVIEALACGLPVVSSNLPFNWDVLDDKNSIMVNPDSIDEITDATWRLYNNSNLCNELSKGALNKAETLSLSHRAENIMDFVKASLE